MQTQAEFQRATGALHPADAARYDDLPISDRNRIIGSPTDALIVKRGHARVPIEDRATILWRDEGSYDLPRRGRENGPVRPYVS
jgi:hypothetical protein